MTAPETRMAGRGADDEIPVPLSRLQRWRWQDVCAHPGSSTQHISLSYRIGGSLDVERLRTALLFVISRHDALRIRIRGDARSPSASLRPVPDHWPLPLIDLTGLPDDLIPRTVDRYGERTAGQPIDLANDLPLRTLLLRRRPDDHLLFLTLHHVLTDGWSAGVFIRHLHAAYHAGNPDLLPRPRSFVDHVIHEEQSDARRYDRDALDWWRGKLAGATLPPRLPTTADPSGNPLDMLAQSAELPRTAASRLRTFARRMSASAFTVGLATLALLLRRRTGTPDSLVWVPFAGNRGPDFEDTIGLFTNRLPMRLSGDEGSTFEQLVAGARTVSHEAFDHGDAPFSVLLEEQGGDGDSSPQIAFQYVQESLCNVASDDDGELSIRFEDFHVQAGTLDLAIYLLEVGDGRLRCWAKHRTAFLTPEEGRRLLKEFIAMMVRLVSTPSSPVIDVLGPWTPPAGDGALWEDDHDRS